MMKLLAILNDGTIVNVINLYIEQGFLEYCNIGMNDYAKVDIKEVKCFKFIDEDTETINNKILKEYLKFIKEEVDKIAKEVDNIKINQSSIFCCNSKK